VEKLVRVVLRGKTVVQQYGIKTLNGNRNALKQNQNNALCHHRSEQKFAGPNRPEILLLLLLLLLSRVCTVVHCAVLEAIS